MKMQLLAVVFTLADVPDDQGHAPMRDAIVRHVKQLLDELQR